MRFAAIVSALIILLLATAACGGSSAEQPGSAQTPGTGATASPTQSFSSLATRAATPQLFVKVATDSSGKKILTDSSGKTLYVLAGDQALAQSYTCTDACLTLWPPLTVPLFTQIEQPTGLNGPIGTFKRDDMDPQLRQLIYKRAPLYRYSGDKAAGDEKGLSEKGWSLAVP